MAVAEVVNRAPVAIVCPGTAVVRAAQHATRTIPILPYDLLGSKLVFVGTAPTQRG